MQRYNIDAKTLNAYINQINAWAKELALENGFIYVNTADTLKDSNGFLDSSLQMSDGYHLNANAYRKILAILKNTEIHIAHTITNAVILFIMVYLLSVAILLFLRYFCSTV